MTDNVLKNSIGRIKRTIESPHCTEMRRKELQERLDELLAERAERNKAKRKGP